MTLGGCSRALRSWPRLLIAVRLRPIIMSPLSSPERAANDPLVSWLTSTPQPYR